MADRRSDKASAVPREQRRLLEDNDAKIAALRKAIKVGEARGLADDYSIEGVLADARRRLKAKRG